MTLTGHIKHIGDTEVFGSNGFRKRELVITTEEQYPQHILIEFVQDKCDVLDNYNLTEKVTIHFNLRGREWTNPQGEVKYFNSIQGWKLDKLEQQPNSSIPNASPQDAFEPAGDLNEEDHDDLPF